MPLAGIGVDMVEIARMERVMQRTPSFCAKVFTEEERAYCDASSRPATHYAARFAAREAVLKALGLGFGNGVGVQDVSVGRAEDGRPYAILRGGAKRAAQEQGIEQVALSLTHTHELAVANAVALREEVRPKRKDKADPLQELNASFREARLLMYELEQTQLAELSGSLIQQRLEFEDGDDELEPKAVGAGEFRVDTPGAREPQGEESEDAHKAMEK